MSTEKPIVKAFPVYTVDRWGNAHLQGGMTLWDYFAAHAPSVPSGYPWLKVDHIEESGDGKRLVKILEPEEERLIRWQCYYADIMMKKREDNDAK